MSASAPAPRSAPALGGFNATLLGLEIRRALRSLRTVILVVAMPMSFLLLYGLPYRDHHPGDGQPLARITVAMAVYGAMIGATSCGAGVAMERVAGWNRQLRLTPLRPLAQVAVKTITAMVLGLIAVLAEFALGAALGVDLPPHVWLLAGLAAWLPSAVFALFGLFTGLVLPSQNVMQLVGPALVLLAVLGGIFIPLSLLPHAIRVVAPFTPAYGAGTLAQSCLGGGGAGAASVLNLLAWTGVFTAGAVWRLRQDVGRS
ncbi:ABC transporter permease [Peterkaempfera bronchialis]|uniref:ABC transporter permease n=1 Tax=Peterkaempfera bronchialis TaxID=2126346 RepID=A0A345SS21_9ACTN|nr:ABC transporter permease [Peterkaempfera bronchialis]AXI76526.1 ABC transporter permease [Peterkaempfera bronchialis]